MPSSVALIAAAIASACATTPAPPPPSSPAAPNAEREQIYERYALEYSPSSVYPTWKRSDGDYNVEQLRRLLESTPRTRSLLDRVRDRNEGIGIPLLFGTLATGLTGLVDGLSNPVLALSISGYVLGGGLITLALWRLFATHDPNDEIAPAYNAALRDELGLPPRPIPVGLGAGTTTSTIIVAP
jgi:hypothetical protein